MPNTTVNMSKDALNNLEMAIDYLPDELVVDIMEDGRIDPVEMMVLLDKLEQVSTQMNITLDVQGACKNAITQLITLAADEARNGNIAQQRENNLDALCSVTMAQVKDIMHHLIESGQIVAGTGHEVDGTGMAANLALDDVRTPEKKETAQKGNEG